MFWVFATCGQADAQLEDHVGEACKVGPVPKQPDGINAERGEGKGPNVNPPSTPTMRKACASGVRGW